jgi:hypothetical protein
MSSTMVRDLTWWLGCWNIYFVVCFWVRFVRKKMTFQFSEEKKLSLFPRSTYFKLFWIIVVLPVGWVVEHFLLLELTVLHVFYSIGILPKLTCNWWSLCYRCWKAWWNRIFRFLEVNDQTLIVSVEGWCSMSMYGVM